MALSVALWVVLSEYAWAQVVVRRLGDKLSGAQAITWDEVHHTITTVQHLLQPPYIMLSALCAIPHALNHTCCM